MLTGTSKKDANNQYQENYTDDSWVIDRRVEGMLEKKLTRVWDNGAIGLLAAEGDL
jgi:hypothetical protein